MKILNRSLGFWSTYLIVIAVTKWSGAYTDSTPLIALGGAILFLFNNMECNK